MTARSVQNWLEDRHLWHPSYDWDHLGKINDAPFELHIEANAKRVVDKHTMEQVVASCEKTILESTVFSGEATDFADRFEKRAHLVSETREKEQHGLHVFSVKDMLVPIVTRIIQAEPLSRCTTGIEGLDDDIGGLATGSVTIAAADTNWGKSNLCIMVADENLKLNRRVLLVSAEDHEEIYGRRILARRARVNAARLRDRKCEDDELVRIAGVVEIAPVEPFFLRAIGTPAEIIASRIAKLCERHGIELVLVDYIQAIRMGRRMQDRRIEVNEATRLLTDAVKNANAAGLFFSQIRRLGKGETKPTKHDLKESGDLENAAEGVLLGYRKRGVYRLKVDKSKDGSQGEYELDWDSNACCFTGGHLASEDDAGSSRWSPRNGARQDEDTN